ncbi:MAG: penicillin-binding protein 2, partial [Candidatus Melainabacteria bacterium]|nr:penicillin-binding protein 2 [Candidatus Melainabacteria bacterium]
MGKKEDSINFKNKVLVGITLSLALILASRLFYLQIFQYKTYTQRAQYSTSRISIIAAPRGIIYDRNKNIIATNKQSISVVAYPNKLKTEEERIKTYNILSKILDTNKDNLKKTLLKLPENAPLPIRLQSNLSVKEATLIIEKQHMLPGIDIQEEPIRFYPNNELAAHVLGYIAQIDEEELSKRPERKLGDLVGKAGIERLFDDVLRGKDGKKIVGVDRFGKPINPSYKHSIIEIQSIPGRNIDLTIDINLQSVAEEALKNSMASGSALVVNSNTGEILALASYPAFDPNVFTKPISLNIWNQFIANKVFLNRSLLAYAPGSIWKPITLFAALDAKVIKPDDKLKVGEAVYLGSTRFGDWTSKEAVYSLQESLAWSRDTAFYQLAQKLTPEDISRWGLKLGAGRKSGIELIGEEVGIVPDSKWKEEQIGEQWYPGNTLHYSIGQGFLLITPLQIARIYSAIANGSKVPKLQLIKTIDRYIKPLQIAESYKIDPSHLEIVKEGLEQCVDSGTGVVSKLENIKVAGKTGSAEVVGSKKTHSWFVAYAPAENPEITVVVINEKAGHGGSVAAVVAKKILSHYFKEDENKEKEELAK